MARFSLPNTYDYMTTHPHVYDRGESYSGHIGGYVVWLFVFCAKKELEPNIRTVSLMASDCLGLPDPDIHIEQEITFPQAWEQMSVEQRSDNARAVATYIILNEQQVRIRAVTEETANV